MNQNEIDSIGRFIANNAEECRMDVQGTLTQRNGTHGDFGDNGSIMQTLKYVIRAHRNADEHTARFEALLPYQREALDMIMHKVGRILCGDPDFADHWHDICGYAKLVEQRCAKG